MCRQSYHPMFATSFYWYSQSTLKAHSIDARSRYHIVPILSAFFAIFLISRPFCAQQWYRGYAIFGSPNATQLHNKYLFAAQAVQTPSSWVNHQKHWTVHTSAKARLTSVMIRIRIRIRDPDGHQNLSVCSLADCQPSLKMSCKFVWKFFRKVANRQTDGQTTTTT